MLDLDGWFGMIKGTGFLKDLLCLQKWLQLAFLQKTVCPFSN